jgi:hypothetical protein
MMPERARLDAAGAGQAPGGRQMEADVDAKHVRHAMVGVMLIGIGAAILARQMGWRWAPDLWRLWPLVFLFLAAAQWSGSRGLLQPMPTYFVCLTAIFLLDSHRVLRFRDSWPLFIVAAGVVVLLGALAHQADRRRRAIHSGKELR